MLMLARLPRLGLPRAVRGLKDVANRARTDGFNEALPRRDIVAPLVCTGVFGFSWWMAEEGQAANQTWAPRAHCLPTLLPTL